MLLSKKTPEQAARDLLVSMGFDEAANYSAGDVAELAQMIHEWRQYKALQVVEYEIRKYLCFSHGHSGQYGDDGELQCSQCAPYGLWDYRRAPLQQVIDVVQGINFERNMKTLKDAGGMESIINKIEVKRKAIQALNVLRDAVFTGTKLSFDVREPAITDISKALDLVGK